MDPKSILLIWNSRLDTADGSSVQLSRMFRESNATLLHIYSEELSSEGGGLPNYHPLRVWLEPALSLTKGAGAIKRQWKRWVLPISSRLAVWRAQRSFASPLPKIAYVVVFNDDHARMASLLLKSFGIASYVLHIMDFFHDDGATQLNGSDFEALVREAYRVRVINERLYSEFSKWRTEGVEIARLLGRTKPCTDLASKRQRILLMTGMLYSTDEARVRFLRDVFVPAWRRFKASQSEPVRWLYCGKSYHMLPSNVAQEVDNLGPIYGEQFEDLLKTAQCGVMPIEHSPNDRWRFSTPSRLVDFLAAGLPFIAPANQGTATGDFLQEHRGNGVTVVGSEADCLAALDQMFNNSQFHMAQSLAASSAAQQYDPDDGRRRFGAVLNELVAAQ